MTPRGDRRWAGMALVGLLLAAAGCASTHVETTSAYTGARLLRPDRVVVAPFTVLTRDIRLDQGVAARVERAVEQEPVDQAELQAARSVQLALQESLVKDLLAKGLPAEAGRAESAAGNTMLVQGQIVSVDQGNQTRRRVIGFGAGRSSITSEVQLLYVAGRSTPQFLESFEAVAASPRTPGIALPIGAGAAAGHLGLSAAVSGGVQGASAIRQGSSNPDAERLAQSIAQKVAGFAATQGWIAAPR